MGYRAEYPEGMRTAVGLVLIAFALVACSTGSAGPAQSASLTVTYWPEGANASTKVKWTLRCGPAGGTLRRPDVACRKLAAGGAKLFARVPQNVACTQIYGGPQVARVSGIVNGKRVWVTFNRTDGCQIERWNKLAPWLLPRAGVA